MDLGALFHDFFTDPWVRAIFALILLDVITGVIAALRTGVFDLQRIAAFYRTNVVPGILGYSAVWGFARFGLDQIAEVGPLLAMLTTVIGAGFVVLALVGSITDNIRRSQAAQPPGPPLRAGTGDR